MTKARRELAALMPSQDLVIEVLDARAPAASANPVIRELRGDKPCLRVLTRSDLADPEVTRAWLEHLRGDRVAVMTATIERPRDTRKRVAELVAQLVPPRDRPLRALIAGVPNTGKSTLINTLMDRAVAAVGDKPAVTKGQQKVVLPSGMIVTDSPGLTWPKIDDEAGALTLALAGSIPDTAIDYVVVGAFGAQLLLAAYPALVAARYKLPALPQGGEALLAEIGRRRGALRAGGVVDLHKAAEVLVKDVRSGAIGKISLERPPATG